MSKDLHSVNITGRVGKAPVFKAVGQKQTSNIVFSVAVTGTEKNSKTGQWEDTTEWFNCVAWGSDADFINKYVGKGAKVGVTGKMRTSKWTNQQGQDQYKTELVVTDFTKISDGKEGAPTTRSGDFIAGDFGGIPGLGDEEDMADIPF